MSQMSFDTDENDRGFLQRYGFAIGVVLLVGAVVLVVAGRNLFSSGKQSQHKTELVLVMPKLPPPPPPPPQPKPPEQKMEEKMIDQVPVDQNEEKPDDKPAEAPQAVTTNIQGSGGPDFGVRSGNGSGYLSGNARHGSGSRWGWYAAKLQMRIGDALRKSPRTKSAALDNLVVRIWPDPTTGRIARAKLGASTGNPALDAAISDEVLTGLQLDEPPPAGMPAPIVMRITARRPQ